MRLYDYAASANCFKVRILIRQLGLDVELVPVDIFDGDTLTDAYRALAGPRPRGLPARAAPALRGRAAAGLRERPPRLPRERASRLAIDEMEPIYGGLACRARAELGVTSGRVAAVTFRRRASTSPCAGS